MIPNEPLLLVFMPLRNPYPQCPRAGLLWPMAHSRGDGTTLQLTWNAPGVGVRGMARSSILPSLTTHSGGNQLLCPEDTETALGTGPLPVRNWGPQTYTWLSWKAGPSATLSLEMTAAPTNSLTATSGETQSQNHPTKAFRFLTLGNDKIINVYCLKLVPHPQTSNTDGVRKTVRTAHSLVWYPATQIKLCDVLWFPINFIYFRNSTKLLEYITRKVDVRKLFYHDSYGKSPI